MNNTLLILIALALAVLRIVGHKSQAFQAVSHIFVSYLFTAAYYEYRETWIEGGKKALVKAYIAIGLTIVEVACFVCGLVRG